MSEEIKDVVMTDELAAKADAIMGTIMHTDEDPVVSTKKLLEHGAHFGHQTRKWNPKMNKYIFGSKNGVHIIDLTLTASKLQEAYLALKKIVADGGKVLFVGTKPQVKEVIKEEALRSGSFYVVNRWLGGTLTNFKTIRRRVKRLEQIEKMEKDGSFDNMPKKEAVLLRKEKEKLLKNLEGIAEMRKVPNAVVVVDPKLEHNAVLEAKKLNIPVFGLLDTNADPDEVNYGIPANDDATKSVQLICGILADAVVEAKGGTLSYAYNVASEDEVSMADALSTADKAEELRQIRQKSREDSQSAKKKTNRKPNKFVQKKVAEEATEAAPVEAKEETTVEENKE